MGSEDKTISVWNFRSNEGNFIQEGECDVIVGMGAPVDFIVPVDQHTFVTGSKNVYFSNIFILVFTTKKFLILTFILFIPY